MSKKLLYLMSFVLVLAVTGTASADQWDITINNPGFEDPVLAEDGWTWLDTPGWTQVGGEGAGIWNVTTADFDPVEAPEGENVVYTENAPANVANGVAQVLTKTFAANTDYTLTASVGNSWEYYFSGYSVQLLAGGTVIAEDHDTLWPDYMLWATSTVAYTYDPADSALVGQPLEIRLLNLGLTKDNPPGNTVGVEFDNVILTIRPPIATNPEPADGADHYEDWWSLTWTPGVGAVEHDVYFGTNFDDVNDATASEPPVDPYKGRQTSEYYDSDLVPGTTYYWRIDEVNDTDPCSPWKGHVWSFRVIPWEAENPSPHDGAIYVDPNVNLSWSAGLYAGFHQVFFGTDPCSLVSDPKFSGPPTYDPGPLDSNTTYFWQINEIYKGRNHPGPIWSFTTTLPKLGTALYEYWDGITPTGQSLSLLYNWPDFPGNPTGTQILTLFEGPTNRGTQFGARIQAWLYAPVTGDYKFWIATDDNGDLNLSSDANPFNKQRISWVSPWAAPRNWDDPDITPSGPIPLVAGQKYYIEGLMKEAGGGDNIAVGWTTPWDDTIQVIPGSYLEPFMQWWAWDPSPADGETEADRPTTLRWRAGSHAAQHQVYFGTSEASMTLQDTLPLGTEEYDPGTLESGQTYYWKVTEVNAIELASPWEGDVWNFTTALCVTLDNMEDYNDRSEIRGVWTDGYASVAWGGIPLGPLNVASSGSNLNASTGVGSPVGDTGTIHNGSQGMVLRYDNDGHTYPVRGEEDWDYDAATFSEIEANTVENLGFVQDWTVEDVKLLTMWFQGHPISDGSYDYDPLTWPAYTQYGRGRDIQGRHDEFYFFSQYPFIGVGEIKAQVVSMENTNGWAKAGVMIREKWTPYSKYAAVFITPEQGVTFQWRDVEDGPTQIRTKPGVSAPQYVRLVRNISGAFEAKHSDNSYGPWQDVNAPGQAPVAPVVLMGTIDDPNLYAGSAVTSHNANQICAADFNNVVITPPILPVNYVFGNIGTNAPEQLYVALQDTMDNIAVVEHDDVNAATLGNWQEWEIPLTDFVGVNLDSIKKVRIGLGDRDVPQPGGSGAIYIDDIRACPSRCIPALAKPYDIAQPYDCIVDEKDIRMVLGDWLLEPTDPGTGNNLVGWWKLDETTGASTAQDSSIYGNHGTLIDANQASDWVTGQIGGALHFDGINDYVDCANDVSLEITGTAISLATWVKYETAVAESGIVMKTTSDEWTDGYGLYADSGAIWFYVSDWDFAASKSFAADNQWHHVAGTYDGSNVRVYVDGDEGTPFSYTQSISNTGHSFEIGRGASNAYNFAGALDDVRLYNVALTNSEILGLFGSLSGLGTDLYEDGAINFKDYSLIADKYLEVMLWP